MAMIASTNLKTNDLMNNQAVHQNQYVAFVVKNTSKMNLPFSLGKFIEHEVFFQFDTTDYTIVLQLG
jgi:hypothetical protein